MDAQKTPWEQIFAWVENQAAVTSNAEARRAYQLLIRRMADTAHSQPAETPPLPPHQGVKVRIIGSQGRRLRPEDDFQWMGIDLVLPEVPREGQSITLDGGSCYIVTAVTWFIDTEVGDRDPLAEKNGPRDIIGGHGEGGTPGRVSVIHVNVKPKDDMATRYGNDFEVAEAARRFFDLIWDDRTAKRAGERAEEIAAARKVLGE
jgi:hypothetical protein